MKYTCNQEKRISQDSMYNLHEISYDLPQFVWLIQTFPDLVCVCGIKEILDQLDRVLLIESANPQLLSYDTIFQLGDFYVSTLLFRHTIFKESPVIPALFLIHERKFQTTHEILFRIANEKVPSLAKSVCPIVTDEEKAINNAIANIIPNVKRLRCWNHIFRGARHWIRSHNISNSKVQEFIAELRELFHKPSLQDYEKAYQSVSPEWDKRIHEYYSKNILPEVNLSVGRWVLEEKGVYSPFSGVVNNQSESFNAILKDLQHWKEVPIDSLILTFYYLQCYFMNEICREMCNQGSYHLHPTFSILLEEAEEKDFIANCVQPDEIVKHIKEGLIADEFTVVEPDHELQMCDTIPTSAPLSQMARAKILIEAGKISFDPKLHLFNVLGSGDNPYVVRLFPTEFCSCPSKGQCYHIIAVKTSIGAMVDTKLNPLKNLNLLRKNTRSRNDKRSGRKRPRRKDMTTDENDSPSNPKKMDTNDDPLDNSGSTHENPEGNLTNPGEDVLIPDENIPSVNSPPPFSPPRYVGEENAPPGASMIYESPIIVSEKMQHVISENDNMFEHKPIGPLYNFIPQQLQSFLPPAFLHSYVVVTHQDKSALDELFNQHQEPYPVVITFPYCDKIYSDVIDDPKSASTTVKILQGMNPILANVLIDYYEVHTWSM